MPFPPTEIAVLKVGGREYRNWKSVRVEKRFDMPYCTFQFSTAEPIDIIKSYEQWRIQPGAPATVYLGGQMAITGFIVIREAFYNAEEHEVMFFGQSIGKDATDTSVRVLDGQQIDGTFTSIVTWALQGTGVSLSAPGDDGKIYPNFNIQQGETPWQVAERLARYQPGMRIYDDGFGTWHAVNASNLPSGALGNFVEGKNILEARGTIDVTQYMHKINAIGQRPTRDDVSTGDMSVIGKADDPTVPETRYLLLPCEEPCTQEMVDGRALHEMSFIWQGIIDVEVKVYGWFDPSGALWNIFRPYTITSPMLDLYRRRLISRQVVFEQSDPGATTTTITMCTPEALSAKITAIDTGPSVASAQDSGPWYGQGMTLQQVQQAAGNPSSLVVAGLR